MKLKILFLTLISFALVACSSARKEASNPEAYAKTFELKDGSKIKVNYGCYTEPYIDRYDYNHCSKQVVIITPADKVADTAGGIIAGIHCIASLNILGTCSSADFKDKENLSGNLIPVEDHFSSYAYPKLIDVLKNKLNVSIKDDYTAKGSIHLLTDRAKLIYDDSDSKFYTLSMKFVILPPFVSYDKGFRCNESKSGFTKAQWEENNYERVNTETKNLIDQCFKKLENENYIEKIGKHFDAEHKHLTNPLM